MSGVLCTLPWPPSVNHTWRATHGKVLLSELSRAYRRLVGAYILVERVPRHWTRDRLALSVLACPPDRRKRDLDNLAKASIDALVHGGVIHDDAHIDVLLIARGAVMPPGELRIRIEELSSLPDTLDWRAWLNGQIPPPRAPPPPTDAPPCTTLHHQEGKA